MQPVTEQTSFIFSGQEVQNEVYDQEAASPIPEPVSSLLVEQEPIVPLFEEEIPEKLEKPRSQMEELVTKKRE